MNTFLWQTYNRLITELDITSRRFLYDKLDINHRLTGIVGPRGVGKTTMLLQFIKENLYDAGNTFYFSADNTYFNETSILEFVNELYQNNKISIFFIDEIHKYKNWNQELKNIYDSFPKIKVFFSGSSSIDLITGSYDLSRRAKLLHLPGLSFREYINIKNDTKLKPYSFDEIISNYNLISTQISKVGNILNLLQEYLSIGYYPIVFESMDTLYDNIANIIDKTIYEDIGNFYKLKTQNIGHFKRILNFMASMPPGEIKTSNIAKHLQIDNKTVDNYLDILLKTKMITSLSTNQSGNRNLTKPVKYYLANTTLLNVINTFLATEINIGTMREVFLMQHLNTCDISVFYPQKGDFFINDTVFEVGGKNKTWQQLKNYTGNKFLVKDDIMLAHDREIPLYLFGFLY